MRAGWLTYAEIIRQENLAPLNQLLKQLETDNNVEAARLEYLAMRHLLEIYHGLAISFVG